MEIDLKNKVVMVTGSARRVGREILLAFAAEGAHVVVHHGHSAEAAAATAQAAHDLGVDALVVQGDHTQHEQILANFEAVKARFGRLDVLVNSAGTFKQNPLLDIPPDEWQQVMDLNVSAPFFCTQEAGKLMRDGENGGCIINIGDNGGLRPWEKRPHHGISKAAVLMLTEVAAKSLASYQIRVNAVIPGPVLPAPDMDAAYWANVVKRIPLQRGGDPPDIARACVFLAQNDFITGAVLRVDGGEYLGEPLA